MKAVFEKLARREDLTFEEAYKIARDLLQGIDEAIAAALLMGLRVKGEAPSEVAGFAKALRDFCVKVELGEDFIDTAGTGGDGANTLNASTAAALVCAYLGVRVAKHGNRSVSSKSGSADFMEALGFNINIGPTKAVELANRFNFTFLFAPNYHPAVKNVMPVRRKLGIRTIFNLVGPLANPANVRRQVIGVGDKSLMRVIAEACMMLGLERALIIHGEPGIDEVSIFGKTLVIEVRGGKIEEYELAPEDLGVRRGRIEEVQVESASQSVEKFKNACLGRDLTSRNFIAANAGLALYLAGRARDPRDGVEKAMSALNEGLLKYVEGLCKASWT